MIFLSFLISLGVYGVSCAGLIWSGVSPWGALFFAYWVGVMAFALTIKVNFNTWAFWKL